MRRFSALVAVLLLVPACQRVVTEELPTEPTLDFPSPFPQQVTVVPVPIPSPEPGGGAPPPPAPAPVPVPTNAPTPRPSNAPPPPSGGGGSTVTRVGAKVFFLECNGAFVPGSEYATTAQLGCRVHFDCTPRDANNQPTTARGTPQWTFSPTHLIKGGGGGGNPYTPAVEAVAEGRFTAFVVIDGVRSDDVNIRFVR